MIKEVVKIYNDALIAKIGTAKALINSIAEPVYVMDGEEIELSLLLNGNEDDVYPFIDDRYHFGIYHKLNSKLYSNEQNKGFGDASKIVCTVDMSLVAWGFTRVLSADDLEQFIIKNTPEQYRIYSSNFDKRQVFDSEFKKVDYMVSEENFLFKINYKVTFKVDKNCIETNEIFTN